MKKYLILFGLLSVFLHGQIIISGSIISEGNPVSGANIMIVDSYDGATSASDGTFSFETFEKNDKTLRIEKIGYDIYEQSILIGNENLELIIELSPVIELKTIVFTAGQMSAKAETNTALLKPLDVVSTAGSMGDNIGALQMLPGTQNNAEDGRLFVRGGDPLETETYIDGLKVYQPYTPTSPQTPVRGRFSPFLFKGINFSTGGYDARFGDAMSGVLDMNTIDFPKENSVDISLMTVGGGAAVNKVWEKSALSFNAQYFNLGFYNTIFKSRDEWLKSPQGASGEAVYRQKFGNALWKTYVAYDFTDLALKQFHINAPNGELFELNNNNIYTNSSLNIPIAKKTDLKIGGSFASSKNDINLDNFLVNVDEKGVFGRAEIVTKIFRKLKWTTGTSVDHENIQAQTQFGKLGRNNLLWNSYTDTEWSVGNQFGIKAGIRNSYSSALEKWILQPRLSLAYQINGRNNLSFAYGKYAQMPQNDFWKEGKSLDFQSANQLLLNYFYQGEKNILRAEIYHKDYHDLITYQPSEFFGYEQISNDGHGKASGLDIFWRNDNQLVKYLDFWISYSYIDSKRLYQDFPIEAQPNYVQNHNLSWVNKYWINSLRSQLGITYKFSSGRPYNNPNSTEFLNQKTRAYHSVDLGWAYLMSPQKILYVGINNIFNIKNEFGYRFSREANAQGVFESEPILAQNNQFFFIGFFWTISTDKSRNQLDNL